MIYLYTAVFAPIGDGGYCARVPDLRGCVTTGKSLADAIEQITDAMSAWLVVAEDEGLEIALPTPQESVKPAPGTLCSAIKADTLDYRSRTRTLKPREKTFHCPSG